MQEIQLAREQLSASFLDAYLRLQKLNAELKHSAGTIVWKGPKKQYSYWQFYDHGKQIQKYVQKSGLEAIRRKIETMKAQHRKRMVLARFLEDVKRALRALRVSWRGIVEKYEAALERRKAETEARVEAKKVAESKRYADNYKHVTDKGDQVGSKSELMIANMLYAQGIEYEYEKEIVLDTVHFKPDFTVYTKDGRVFYWEHAGMLENPEYKRKHEEKLAFYRRHGIRLQENLIVTRDRNGTFSANEVRRTIEYYELNR